MSQAKISVSWKAWDRLFHQRARLIDFFVFLIIYGEIISLFVQLRVPDYQDLRGASLMAPLGLGGLLGWLMLGPKRHRAFGLELIKNLPKIEDMESPM